MIKYKKGKIIKVCITGIEKYGVFVNLDNSYSGLIHISEISDGFVKNIKDYVELGETIYAKVIDIDEKAFHVKLSIKNINYRIRKNNNNVSKINEVGTGFLILYENREVWIEEKLKELA